MKCVVTCHYNKNKIEKNNNIQGSMNLSDNN